MRTLAVYNVKGGVGKTASAVNLAYLASTHRLSTLLWDLDPQGGATHLLEAPGAPADKRLWAGKSDLNQYIGSTAYPGLDLLAATLDARHLDVWLRHSEPVGSALKGLLKPLTKTYDLVVLDCPPSLSHLSENVFRAADLVLVPVVPTPLSLRALATLIQHFKDEGLPRDRLKPFYSMADRRRLMHRTLIEQPPKTMRDVCRSVIPYSASVERMAEHRAPLETFDSSAYAAEEFRGLWKEVWREIKPAS